MKTTLILLLFVASLAQMITKTNITGVYSQIAVPIELGRIWTGEIFKETIIVIPNFIQLPKNLTKYDLCQIVESKLINLPSTIWDKLSSNPCEKYFCSNGQLSNDSSIHYGLHSYCTQCLSTYNQGFNQTLSTKNCSGFEKNYCDGYCSEGSTCIYFQKNQPLCYVWKDNYYYGKEDYVHMKVVYFTTLTRLYILLPVCFAIFMISIFIFIVPEVFLCFKTIKNQPNLSFIEKFKVIFSLRSQVRIMVFGMGISWVIALALDILIANIATTSNLSNLFSVIVIVFQIGFIFFSFASIITLWAHICETVDSGDLDAPLSTKNKVIYVLLLSSFFIFGAVTVLCFLIYRINDGDKRSWGTYLFGANVLFIGVLFVLLTFVLFIFLFKILARLTQQRILGIDTKNLQQYTLQLKVS